MLFGGIMTAASGLRCFTETYYRETNKILPDALTRVGWVALPIFFTMTTLALDYSLGWKSAPLKAINVGMFFYSVFFYLINVGMMISTNRSIIAHANELKDQYLLTNEEILDLFVKTADRIFPKFANQVIALNRLNACCIGVGTLGLCLTAFYFRRKPARPALTCLTVVSVALLIIGNSARKNATLTPDFQEAIKALQNCRA